MCGRYTFADPNRIAEIMLRDFGVIILSEVPRFNVAPSQAVPIIRATAEGKLVAEPMRWGLIPSWDASDKPKIAPINIRSEGALAKPMFRQPLRRRRVLFPADGFFEWQPPQQPGISGAKTPYYIQLIGGAPFVIAGVCEDATAVRPEASCALLTTGPNELMQRIHHRMPVILDAETAKRWVRPGPISEEEMADFCRPFPASAMTAKPVSSLVNSVRNDGPAVIADPENSLF